MGTGTINLLSGRGWVVWGWGVPGPPPRRAEEDARLLILTAGCEPTSLGYSVGRARPFMDVAASPGDFANLTLTPRPPRK